MRYGLRGTGAMALIWALVRVSAAAEPQAVGPEITGPQSTSFTGTVVETMNASRYTYVLINTGKEKVWAAAPVFPVKIGDPVSISGGMVTKDFYSTVLKRKFDELYLVGKIWQPGSEPAAPVPDKLPAGHPAINWEGDEATTNMDLTGIHKPEGGKTVAEIWAQKSKLAGQKVIVRAKVVKVLPDIMDATWLHLRDGTGAEGQNDLTVTTKTLVKVGQVVTVNGILLTDKDYGSGYRYDVIVEDAIITP